MTRDFMFGWCLVATVWVLRVPAAAAASTSAWVGVGTEAGTGAGTFFTRYGGGANAVGP